MRVGLQGGSFGGTTYSVYAQRCKVFGMLSKKPWESVYDYARESISSF